MVAQPHVDVTIRTADDVLSLVTHDCQHGSPNIMGDHFSGVAACQYNLAATFGQYIVADISRT